MENTTIIGIAIDAAALVAIFIYAPIANYLQKKKKFYADKYVNHIYIDNVGKKIYYIFPFGGGAMPYTQELLHQLKCELILKYGDIPVISSAEGIKKEHKKLVSTIKHLL